jgi:hypothetical protein
MLITLMIRDLSTELIALNRFSKKLYLSLHRAGVKMEQDTSGSGARSVTRRGMAIEMLAFSDSPA